MKKQVLILTLLLIFSSCSQDLELKIHAGETMKVGQPNKLTITRSQSGNNQINNSGQDGIIYYLSSLDDSIQFKELDNDTTKACQGKVVNVQSSGKMMNTYARTIHFEDHGQGDILAKIDCYPKMVKFNMKDSLLSLLLIIEDEDHPHVRDTVSFNLSR
ncbi:MAG: hypothetical protein ACXIUD_17495 [Mongoliitalea sp.]